MSPPTGINYWKVRLRNPLPFADGFFTDAIVHGDRQHTPGGTVIIKNADGALLVGARSGWGLFWFADKFEIEDLYGQQR